MVITDIAIDKGLDMPKKRVVYSYPYEQMDIGDSFSVPLSARQKVLNANFRAARRLGIELTAKTDGEVVRIWRTR